MPSTLWKAGREVVKRVNCILPKKKDLFKCMPRGHWRP